MSGNRLAGRVCCRSGEDAGELVQPVRLRLPCTGRVSEHLSIRKRGQEYSHWTRTHGYRFRLVEEHGPRGRESQAAGSRGFVQPVQPSEFRCSQSRSGRLEFREGPLGECVWEQTTASDSVESEVCVLERVAADGSDRATLT